MPRNCTKFGNDFRQKFNYTGKLTKECMGSKLWNEYYKMLMKERFSSSEHKQVIEERKEKRKAAREQKKAKARFSGEQYKHYCQNYKDIENFYEAQKDNFKGWICHHKLEQIFTSNELVKMNIYYNCKPGELIFIRINDHNNNTKLHYGCRIRDKSKCGRHRKILEKI